jgi:tellurite resistance protein
MAGLSLCWSSATGAGAWTTGVADVLWCLTAAVWLLVLSAYTRSVVVGRRWRTELLDPVFAPFVVVGAIVPMLLGTALGAHAHVAGVVIFSVGFTVTAGLGGWLTGQWVVNDMTLQQWHPGYFLPTVAGGLVASTCSSTLELPTLARLCFGYGLVCWFLLGSILFLRLFTQPALPLPLTPTLAIEVAPPVVAGTAWFGINHGRVDTVALGLAGYAMLMVMMQLRLVPLYRRVRFGLGSWAFCFSYCAVFADALRWVNVTHPRHEGWWSSGFLAVVSVAVIILAARTATALRHSSFLSLPSTPSPTTTPRRQSHEHRAGSRTDPTSPRTR